ncbi:MAG TPA: gephyrin-like molybdotransferase Glp [Egibacteraceae bacterium]|nr:gephyrin-like molybdotransferase Glp [Egibacteraceae bacterium]
MAAGAAFDELAPLDSYRRNVLGQVAALEPIDLGLLEAQGCVLAEDVTAERDIPRFANSAMDGYAVRAADVNPDTPLEVIGESAAGGGPVPPLRRAAAVRIMTGAELPDGADAVVPVELSVEEGGKVLLRSTPQPGEHVRPAGEDVREGQTVLTAGQLLGPAQLGMAAALGRARIRARPRPRVVVLATGDELVEPGASLTPGKIYDSNSYMLTAMVREAGATGFRHGIVGDTRRALAEAFEGALSHADALVTSGGVSAGRYDLVKRVLAELGDVRFTRVAMQPGMPQAFGFISGIPCFGLPGNPVSAFVSFEVFVRPAIRRLQGREDINRSRVSAVMDASVRSPAGKVSFLRVALRRDDGGWHARPTGPQGSGILGSVVAADGLAEVPAERTEVPAGERLIVHLLGADR